MLRTEPSCQLVAPLSTGRFIVQNSNSSLDVFAKL